MPGEANQGKGVIHRAGKSTAARGHRYLRKPRKGLYVKGLIENRMILAGHQDKMIVVKVACQPNIIQRNGTHQKYVRQIRSVVMLCGLNLALTLEEGATKHLVSEGCGFLPALTRAMGEYDLVAMKDGQFFFGDRAGDLTKARPTMLTPFPLVKK